MGLFLWAYTNTHIYTEYLMYKQTIQYYTTKQNDQYISHTLYEGHPKSYLPEHHTIMLASCFWHRIIDRIKYITAADDQPGNRLHDTCCLPNRICYYVWIC